MLHAKLKTATRPLHARLDEQLARVLTANDLTVTAYASFLGGMWGFVAPWESAAAAATVHTLPHLADSRRKAFLLKDDLRSLGQPVPTAEASDDVPVLANLSAALGSMYVMEGSTLGGRVLAPRVRERLSLSPGVGTQYFESYGPAVGQRWAEFLQILESCVPESGHDAAVTAACATFEGLERWLGHSNTFTGKALAKLPVVS